LRQGNGILVLACLLLAAVVAVVVPAVASAETFKVTTQLDGDDKSCDAHCTLREAVARAGPDDDVSVPAGTYVLSLGELFLTSDKLVGAGARSTIIDGASKSRVLWVTDGTTEVSGVTIRFGNGAGRAPSGVGGGI
jgi:CSLREA domain-containing protein